MFFRKLPWAALAAMPAQAAVTISAFTPPVVGPSILFGRVDGEVVRGDDDDVAKDRPYFSFALSDKQYAAVLAVVDRWREAPQQTRNAAFLARSSGRLAGTAPAARATIASQ